MNIRSLFKATQRGQVYVSLAFAVSMVSNAAWAENPPPKAAKEPVSIQLTLKRIVTDAAGKEKLEDAPKVKPGELVEYSAVYRNRSKAAVTGLNASLPVPFGLVYVAKSAKPKSALVSTDGAKFAQEPLMQTVKDKEGKEAQVEVPVSEYRSLRWAIGTLEAGKKVVVSARMRVVEVAKPAEAPVNKPASAVDLVTKPEAPAAK